MLKALFLSSLVVNLGLLLGRLSGFVREAFIASVFGVSTEADLVVLMLTVPDLLVNILMGGALGAVLVPEFSQQPQKSRLLLYQALLFFGVLFLVISAGFYWQSDLLAKLLAPGFSTVKAEQAALVLGWVIWLMPLTVLAGVVTAYLHAQNRFTVASLGTLIVNSAIIMGLLFVYYCGFKSLYWVALFVLLGGALRLLSQLLQTGMSWAPIAGLQPFQLNLSMLIRYGQAVLSGSVLLLLPVVARAIASYQGDGGVALFNYASRLVEFPLAIAVTFLTVILFPRLSQSYAKGDQEQYRQLVRYGVQLTLALAVVAAVALIITGKSYAHVVYGYGDMSSEGLKKIEALVSVGLIGLPLQGLSVYLTAVFNAQKNTLTPLLLNSLGLLFFLFSGGFGLFGEGLEALMWSMIASYGLVCGLHLAFLKIEFLEWWNVFFEKDFFGGMILGTALLGYVCSLIEDSHLSMWLSLFLAGISALLSICLMLLLNEEVRSIFKERLYSR